MNESGQVENWRDSLSGREQNELLLAKLYAEKCNHGTTGHNRLILIAKLAAKLDLLQGQICVLTDI